MAKFILYHLFIKKKHNRAYTYKSMIWGKKNACFILREGKKPQKYCLRLAVKTTLQQSKNYNHVSCILPPTPWLCHLQCMQICMDLEILLKHRNSSLPIVSPCCSSVRPALGSRQPLVSLLYTSKELTKSAKVSPLLPAFPVELAISINPPLLCIFVSVSQVSNQMHQRHHNFPVC